MYLPSSTGSACGRKKNAFPECKRVKESLFQIHIYYRLQVEHWVVTRLLFTTPSHARTCVLLLIKAITALGLLEQLTFFQISVSHGFHFSMLYLDCSPKCQTMGCLDWLSLNQPQLSPVHWFVHVTFWECLLMFSWGQALRCSSCMMMPWFH